MLKFYKIVTNTYEDIIGVEKGWVTKPGPNSRLFFGFRIKDVKEWCLKNSAILMEVKDENRSKS